MTTNTKKRHASKPKTKPKACQLPEATEDEYESLKASIEAHGPLLTLLQDSKGGIIDGRLRKKIYEELGITKYPTEVLKVDAQIAEQIRCVVNLCRKHASLDSRRQLARLRLVEDPEQSDRDVGRLNYYRLKPVGWRRS